jgi:hypothetical protein
MEERKKKKSAKQRQHFILALYIYLEAFQHWQSRLLPPHPRPHGGEKERKKSAK